MSMSLIVMFFEYSSCGNVHTVTHMAVVLQLWIRNKNKEHWRQMRHGPGKPWAHRHRNSQYSRYYNFVGFRRFPVFNKTKSKADPEVSSIFPFFTMFGANPDIQGVLCITSRAHKHVKESLLIAVRICIQVVLHLLVNRCTLERCNRVSDHLHCCVVILVCSERAFWKTKTWPLMDTFRFSWRVPGENTSG